MTDPIAACEHLLRTLSITDYKLIHHEAVATVEAHRSVLAAKPLSGVQCKNLFLKDKKNKKQFLVTLPADSIVNLKTLSKLLGVGELRFDDSLTQALSVERGHLSPLSILNDASHSITQVFDQQFEQIGSVMLIHPNVNTSTMQIKAVHVIKLIQQAGNPIVFIDSMQPDINSTSAAAAAKGASSVKPGKQANSAKATSTQQTQSKSSKNQDGIDRDKTNQFADWFVQVVRRSEMIEYSDISGCYILRPWSFSIWEEIQQFVDSEIKKLGVKNSYFPMFVTKAALEAEADHIEGFAPEVAWVTKSGNTELEEPIAVRPTSETIMYSHFAKWIRSHRDLPLKLNQWCNVVRWEFKCPTPFIRSREFLWQEGHTAHATKQEADKEVLDILEIYARVYEELLAVPVVRGKKTETEKFAGGYYTTTVEAVIPTTGRGIQGATSHCLGENFAKLFKIQYESTDGSKQYVWQNSWGITTRSIGVMIMTHADNFGLVLPPRIAPYQVVIVPIVYAEDKSDVVGRANEFYKQLTDVHIRCHVDDRSHYTPGWKYSHWELKGVSLRIELGPKDMEAQVCQVHRRDFRDKSKAITLQWAELALRIPQILEEMQNDMYHRAKHEIESRRSRVSTWSDFMAALEKRHTVLAPHCEDAACEKQIKQRSGEESKADTAEETTDAQAAKDSGEKLTGAAKSLCIPFGMGKPPQGTKCVGCDRQAVNYTLFGRSY